MARKPRRTTPADRGDRARLDAVISQRIDGHRNVQIGHVGPGANVTITVGGDVRELPLERAGWSLGSSVVAPSVLVRARYREVPFLDRGGLLAELRAWADDTAAFGVCLIGGRGGSGKTRLAVELCERLEGDRWTRGMLTATADAGAIDALVRAPQPRLVVVDYAETRPEQLDALLPALAQSASATRPVRVVLLVRAIPRGGASGWPDALRPLAGDAVDALLGDLMTRVLEDHPLEQAERDTLFTAAADAFARRAGVPPPASEPPEALSRPVYATPLMVVIGAYLVVHDEAELPTSRDDVLEELLRHEDKYWLRSARARAEDPDLRRRVVAIATLAGADREADAVGTLSLVPDLADASTERRAALARWVHDLYPVGAGWWNPLEPDIVGEHLVATTYAEHPQVLRGVLATDDPRALAQPLDLCARAARNHPTLADALGAILGERLGDLCRLAVSEAEGQKETAELLGEKTLGSLLRHTASAVVLSPEALTSGLRELPSRERLTLGPLTAELRLQRTQRLRDEVASGVDELLPELAGALFDESMSLGWQERFEESLSPLAESIAIHRQLAERGPEHLPSLAMALVLHAKVLGASHRHGDALVAGEEVVAMYRELVRLDAAAFLPDLADALETVSHTLGDLEQHDAALDPAEQAVAIHRWIADDGSAESLLGLAGSLEHWSEMLGELGRHADALAASEEAVGIHRRLTGADSERLHGLAMSLEILAARLHELERSDEAQGASREALAIRRRLADASPDEFLRDFSAGLYRHSAVLGILGHNEEALPAGDEAITLRRQLAESRPEFLPGLAMSLVGQAFTLGGLGRHEDALAAGDEGVTIFRDLARARPSEFLPELADALVTVARELGKLGRPDDALAANGEAVAVFRQIAESRPDDLLPKLAESLDSRSFQLDRLGRIGEALEATDEAISVHRRLSIDRPEEFAPKLAESLQCRWEQLSELNRHHDALDCAEELVDLNTRLVAGYPERLGELTASVASLALTLCELERFEDALPAYDEAVARYRDLVEVDPEEFQHDLAQAMFGRALALQRLRRDEEALTGVEEALAALRKLGDDADALGELTALLRIEKRLGRRVRGGRRGWLARLWKRPT